jgi:predicted transcriptional regulator
MVFVVVMIQSHLFMNMLFHELFNIEENNVASNTVRSTRTHAQLQMAPTEYACETKLVELRQNTSWNFDKGSKRGRLEIMAEILYFCNQQKGKTKIMYKTNLNYAQLKRHLKSLTSKGLLDANTNKYFTTQKGQHFLEIFAQLNAMLKSA